jgi:hypothetical protein
MEISAKWSKPITLKDGNSDGLIFKLDLDAIPSEPGVYIFARCYSSKVEPIYIGETVNLRTRINSHLKSSVRLLTELKNTGRGNGKRILIYCTVLAHSIDKAKSQVMIIEKALILHAQSEGHSLFNTKGTRLPTDVINFSGNRTSEAIAPRFMRVKQALTRKHSPKKLSVKASVK